MFRYTSPRLFTPMVPRFQIRSSTLGALALVIIVSHFLTGCSSSSDTTSKASYPGGALSCATGDPSPQVTPSISAASNVVALSVNGAQCRANGGTNLPLYPNEPCVSVTVCKPGTSTCVTIGGILLDTGSFGLRIFGSALQAANSAFYNTATHTSADLNQVSVSSKPVGECAQFGSGSDWGPVVKADVKVGGETASNISMQVIDDSFATAPTSCGTPDTTPGDANTAGTGFNGILGVGLFATDCGDGCDPNQQGGSANNGIYFACTSAASGATCSGTGMPITSLGNPPVTDQVINPVSAFPSDNNGVMLALPPANVAGSTSLEGYLVFGIGTESNNVPSGTETFNTNNETQFMTTTLPGTTPQTYQSFIDSGSNGIFLQQIYSNLTTCANDSYFYCPQSCSFNITATNTGGNSNQTGNVTFQIANYDNLYAHGRDFSNSAGVISSAVDYGLPFFLGRSVFVGIEPYVNGHNSPQSSLGIGPLWAY